MAPSAHVVSSLSGGIDRQPVTAMSHPPRVSAIWGGGGGVMDDVLLLSTRSGGSKPNCCLAPVPDGGKPNRC